MKETMFAMLLLCAGAAQGAVYCNPFAAPAQVQVTPDGDLFFYAGMTLGNGARVRVGFEFDGDRWEAVEQAGFAGWCQAQFDRFQAATLKALASQDCALSRLDYPLRSASTDMRRYARTAARFCLNAWDSVDGYQPQQP